MSRKHYLRKVKFVNTCSLISHTLFAIGILSMLTAGMIVESPYKYLWLIFLLIGICGCSAAASIEYLIINRIIIDGDVKYSTIFSWQEDLKDKSYKTWREKNHLPDTNKNYQKYLKVRRTI